MIKKLILFVVVTSFFTCNTEQKMPEDFDYGSIENGIYTNDFFKMTIPFNTDWDVQSRDQMDALSKSGTELLTNESTKQAVKASEINNANLFTAFKYKPGFEEAYNYSIAIVAENTKLAPHVQRGSDYLIEAKKIMSQTMIDYEFEETFTTKTIDNQTFDIMNVSGNYMGAFFNQQYMTTVINGFSLSIIISYNTDEQLKELEHLVNGISFYDGKSKKKAS
ncbi:hypothetical protein [Psychroserpens damuponensis]|uniref:hypothetical protein n=1 Tax=Psychroserpens damuponensis TaxID=943936 RepID=UPI00058CD051|nr:hypothetical protein [Psychroserpens damuponensis]